MQAVPRSFPISAAAVVGVALVVTILPACSSKRAVFDEYTKAGVQAESYRSGADAEAYYVSALHRARTTLGKQEQSDALYQLGVFYRREARFAESARALTESLDLAADARLTDPVAIGRRRVDLAKSLAALNRWGEGAAALRSVVPDLGRFAPAEATEIRELLAVYRARITALGGDPAGLSAP